MAAPGRRRRVLQCLVIAFGKAKSVAPRFADSQRHLARIDNYELSENSKVQPRRRLSTELSLLTGVGPSAVAVKLRQLDQPGHPMTHSPAYLDFLRELI